MKVELLKYEDLTEEEQDAASDNGSGKKYANYIRISDNGQTIAVHSDAMDSKEISFLRGLAWVPELLEKCYSIGVKKGGGEND